MASVEPRGNGSWRATICGGYDAQGKKIRLHRTIKVDPSKTINAQRKEAERKAAEIETDYNRHLLTDAKKITVKQLAGEYMDSCRRKGLALSTISGYEWLLAEKIVPMLGKVAVQDVTPRTIGGFYQKLQDAPAKTNRSKTGKLSGTTQLHYHRLLHAMFGFAVRNQYITVNPVSAVEPPRKDTQETQFYELEDCGKLLTALDGLTDEQWRLFFYMSIYTGMRPGEQIGLDWTDIDLDKHVLTVRAGCAPIKGKGTVRTDRPKTAKSVRTIDLPGFLVSMLKEHRMKQMEYRMQFGSGWSEPNAVFTGTDGRRFDASTPTQKFQRIIKANHLRPITLYGLRHTAATIMIAQGINARDVAQRLGHAQTSTTLNIYAHAFRDANTRATDAIVSALESVRKQA